MPLCSIVCKHGKDREDDEHKRNIFERQIQQLTTMMKSLAFFSKSNFKYIILTDSLDTFREVQRSFNDLPSR